MVVVVVEEVGEEEGVGEAVGEAVEEVGEAEDVEMEVVDTVQQL